MESKALLRSCDKMKQELGGILSVMLEGSATIEKMQKYGTTNVSKGKSLSVRSLCRSVRHQKLFVHVCTKAVRKNDFQLNFGFGFCWLHLCPFEMFTGAVTFRHESFELDLEPLV